VTKPKDDHYSDEESNRRFEAALRGARVAKPQPMAEMPRKRAKKTGPSGQQTATKKNAQETQE
jgi:hypothetical protein